MQVACEQVEVSKRWSEEGDTIIKQGSLSHVQPLMKNSLHLFPFMFTNNKVQS